MLKVNSIRCSKCKGVGTVELSPAYAKTLEAVRLLTKNQEWVKIIYVHHVVEIKRSRSGTNRAVEHLIAKGLLEKKMRGRKSEWPIRVRVI